MTKQEEAELAVSRARTFFQKLDLPKGNYLTSYYWEGSSTVFYAHTACAAGLFARLGPEEIKETVAFSSCYQVKPEQEEVANAFWKFLTDPEKSPWRKLHPEKFEPIIRDGTNLQNGFLIPAEIVREYPILPFKNMLIAFRNCMEFYEHIAFWYYATKEGIDPYKAYHLCSSFCLNKDKIVKKVVNNLNHWPIPRLTSLDLKSFKEGEFKDHSKVSALFSKFDQDGMFDEIKYYDYEKQKMNRNPAAEVWNTKIDNLGKVVQGKFGSYREIDFKDIVDLYSVIEENESQAKS